jgi:hypothetical protein
MHNRHVPVVLAVEASPGPICTRTRICMSTRSRRLQPLLAYRDTYQCSCNQPPLQRTKACELKRATVSHKHVEARCSSTYCSQCCPRRIHVRSNEADRDCTQQQRQSHADRQQVKKRPPLGIPTYLWPSSCMVADRDVHHWSLKCDLQ